MRQVLSISLPAVTIKSIKSLSKKRGFASVSDYLKRLIDEDKDIISADDLLLIAKEAQKEYEEGRSIKATSMADLL